MPPSTNTSQASGTYCRFTASQSSGSVDATATLRPEGVEIDLDAGHPRRVWQYAKLTAQEPLRPNAIDVLLSSSEEPGARLFVQGREFATSLKEHAPHLTARAERWRGARPWLFLFGADCRLVRRHVRSRLEIRSNLSPARYPRVGGKGSAMQLAHP